MKYRPEIDGLRALAVLAVIFFHAGITIFRGGYVGVDVFFVISGYLITTIILGDMAQEMLLEGSKVMPEKLLSAGFKFEYPQLEGALLREIKPQTPAQVSR